MPFWFILLPTAATSVFGTPKRLISCPSYGPIWVDGRVLGTHFRRRIRPCAGLHPFRVYERVQIPEIVLAIVAMHELLVKKMRPLRLEASMPPSASAGIAKRKQFIKFGAECGIGITDSRI